VCFSHKFSEVYADFLSFGQHGVVNETRQYTISGRRLDMATERLDNSSIRLMELDGLVAHVKGILMLVTAVSYT